MKIIDGRAFVPFEDMKKTGFYTDISKRTSIAREKYNTYLDQSVFEQSIERYFEEMDALNIEKAIVPARLAIEYVSNRTIVNLLEQYPERFIGFASLECDMDYAIEEIDQYIVNGPCSGLTIEPGCGKEKIAIHDKRLYPIYQKCQDNQIPLMVGFGGMLYPSMKLYKPEYLDQVLQDFPNLHLCAMHGGWPYVAELCWMALMHKNFYIMPDLYMSNTAFSNEYAKAANTLIKTKIIYSSCYPVISQKESIRFHRESGIEEEFYENIFYKNVCRFLEI